MRYHETATGYAESEESDPKKYSLKDIKFSTPTIEESSEEMKDILGSL